MLPVQEIGGGFGEAGGAAGIAGCELWRVEEGAIAEASD